MSATRSVTTRPHMLRFAVTRLAALAATVAVASSASPPTRAPEPPSARIQLDQLGFTTHGHKRATIVGPTTSRFAVLTERGDTAFGGALSAPERWAPSEETVRQAVFDRLTTPGRYVLAVAGVGRSAPFTVGDAPYHALARAAVKAFYFQRASVVLPATYAGEWARGAGHPDTAVLVHPSAAGPGRPAGTVLRSPGGWYDAGDYNKYVVNSGISTYTLLLLAEQFPAPGDSSGTTIPESANALPDVLDEALWNLRWMRTMQDPRDGGVYHKLTNAEFDRFEMPGLDPTPRWVVQKSTAATLDFAAVAAHAALVVARYGDALPGLADSLTGEALAAWRWARQHPDSVYDQARLDAGTAPAIHTGEYGDSHLEDERQWAAAELHLATRADSFLTLAAPLAAPALLVPDWGSVRTLGIYSLVAHRDRLPAGFDTAALVGRLASLGDTLVARAGASAYGVAMTVRDFGWGSNATVANQGVALVQRWRATGDTASLAAARGALDYLLGRNATGYSFVTGFGARTPMHPHHRPSASDGVDAPVPGLLVGGPNPGQQDRCPGYPSRAPARSYVDSTCAYAANEVAINWNAPLAYLAAALDAADAADASRLAAPGATPVSPVARPASLSPPSSGMQPTFAPDHATGIYARGERVGWTVTLPRGVAPGSAVAGPYTYVVRRDGGTVVATGRVAFRAGRGRIETSLDEPAMLAVEVRPPRPDSAFGSRGTGGPGRIVLGAAVAPDGIRAAEPKPADFDAFWRSKIAQLGAVPMAPVVTPLESEAPGVELATVRLDNLNGAHVYAHLARPTRAGRVPALVIYHWASPPYPLQKAWATEPAARGFLVLDVEPHDVPPDMPQAFYDALPAAIRQYNTLGQRHRDDSYFLQMYLGDYRAIEYLATRPEWDGTTLAVMGTSMGGQQSFAMAGLNSRVTALLVNVPSGADVTAARHGRGASYPFWDVTRPEVLATARYFDTANFASRITARSLVAMGFIDDVSTPAGVWSVFNQIRGPKEAVPMPESPHNHLATPESERAWTVRSAAWLDALAHGRVPEPASR